MPSEGNLCICSFCLAVRIIIIFYYNLIISKTCPVVNSLTLPLINTSYSLTHSLTLSSGIAEIFVSTPGEHKIVFKKRKGLIKLAIETGSSLIPCYVFGGTDFFCNLITGGYPAGQSLIYVPTNHLALVGWWPPSCSTHSISLVVWCCYAYNYDIYHLSPSSHPSSHPPPHASFHPSFHMHPLTLLHMHPFTLPFTCILSHRR